MFSTRCHRDGVEQTNERTRTCRNSYADDTRCSLSHQLQLLPLILAAYCYIPPARLFFSIVLLHLACCLVSRSLSRSLIARLTVTCVTQSSVSAEFVVRLFSSFDKHTHGHTTRSLLIHPHRASAAAAAGFNTTTLQYNTSKQYCYVRTVPLFRHDCRASCRAAIFSTDYFFVTSPLASSYFTSHQVRYAHDTACQI